jgi:hypothetical protein
MFFFARGCSGAAPGYGVFLGNAGAAMAYHARALLTAILRALHRLHLHRPLPHQPLLLQSPSVPHRIYLANPLFGDPNHPLFGAVEVDGMMARTQLLELPPSITAANEQSNTAYTSSWPHALSN